MPAVSKLPPWWLEPQPAGTAEPASAAAGLSAAEAEARLVRSGPNLLREKRTRSLLRQFIARFRNPLILILLVASAVSAFTGEVADFLIITGIVLLSVTLDFVQEMRAGKAAEKLRQSVSVRARVLREGREQDIPVVAVVPGDIVLLSAGDLIPADAWVVEADDFFVKQALLTGESYPVEKRPADEIVGLCTRYEAQGAQAQRDLDDAALAAARDQSHALEEEGFRVLSRSRACSPAGRSRRWTTSRCAPAWKRRTCSAGSIPRRRIGSSWRSRPAGTWSATWATASTTRRPCNRRTSACRWIPPWTWPGKRPT
jgi:hypothetical protein